MVKRVHDPSNHIFLIGTYGVTLKEFLEYFWFIMGGLGSIVGAEYKANEVEEVVPGFLVQDFSSLV